MRLRATANERRRDAEVARHFGPAALVVGAFDLGFDFLGTTVETLRDEGRLRLLPRSCSLHDSGTAGPLGCPIPAAAEARRLAEELADPQAEATADTAVSLIAAYARR